MERGDPGGDAAAPVRDDVAGDLVGLLPVTHRPQHVAEVRSHVVPVVPLLGPLGVLDPVAQPAHAPLVLDHHRCAGSEHAIRPCRVGLQARCPSAADRLLRHVPATGPPGDGEDRSEGAHGIDLGRLVTGGNGKRDGAAAMLSRTVQAPVEHVDGRQAGGEPPSQTHDFIAVIGFRPDLNQASAQHGHAHVKAVAQEVAGIDQRRQQGGGAARLARIEKHASRSPVRGGGRLVVVGGRLLGGARRQEPRLPNDREARWRASDRATIEAEGLPVRRQARGRGGGPERVCVGLGEGPRRLEVCRRVSVVRQLGTGGDLSCDTLVQPAALRDREGELERIADERVAKLEPARGHRGHHEEARLELRDGRGGLVRRVPAHGRHQVEVEAAPDDRRRVGDPPGARSQDCSAPEDRIGQRVRNGWAASVGGIGGIGGIGVEQIVAADEHRGRERPLH